MAARVIPILEKIKNRNVYCYPVRDMEFSANPDQFNKYAKEYVSSIISHFNPEIGQNIVMDQPFPGNNPQKCFDYFEDAHAVVVDRDPRDNYLFAKKFLFHKGRSIPSDDVKAFVAYYKGMRENMPYKENDPCVLRINMESMIYDYEKTTQKVIEFCKLNNWSRPKSIFDPSLSISNTQVFKRFPEYSDDIKYIERNLPEYLFDFDKYGNVDTSGKMFYGRSPLNKR